MWTKAITPASVCLAAGTALGLLVCLSVPISGVSIGQYANVKFGVFGWCSPGRCSPPFVGYNPDLVLLSEAKVPSGQARFTLGSGTRSVLTNLLVVHVVATGLILFTFIFSLIAHVRGPSHSANFYLVIFVMTIAGSIFAVLAFIIDILVFIPHHAYGTWLALGSAIASLIAIGIRPLYVSCLLLMPQAAVGCGRRTIVSRKKQRQLILENTEMSGQSYFKEQAALEQQLRFQNGNNVPQYAEYLVDKTTSKPVAKDQQFRSNSIHSSAASNEIRPDTSPKPQKGSTNFAYPSAGTDSTQTGFSNPPLRIPEAVHRPSPGPYPDPRSQERNPHASSIYTGEEYVPPRRQWNNPSIPAPYMQETVGKSSFSSNLPHELPALDASTPMGPIVPERRSPSGSSRPQRAHPIAHNYYSDPHTTEDAGYEVTRGPQAASLRMDRGKGFARGPDTPLDPMQDRSQDIKVRRGSNPNMESYKGHPIPPSALPPSAGELDYYEDIDARFEDPSTAGGREYQASGKPRHENIPMEEQLGYNVGIIRPGSADSFNGGTALSPTNSVSSNFTSISQRGPNPHWKPPVMPYFGAYGAGGPMGVRPPGVPLGPRPPPPLRQERQNLDLVAGFDDFSVGVRGKNKRQNVSPAVLPSRDMTYGGRYPR